MLYARKDQNREVRAEERQERSEERREENYKYFTRLMLRLPSSPTLQTFGMGRSIERASAGGGSRRQKRLSWGFN